MVNRLKKAAKDERFDVIDLFKNIDESEAAERITDFFTEIGNKFAPLWKEDIPVTDRTEDDIFIEEQEVQKRLHACKKPKGLLSGDVFPFLLTKHTHLLAKPLTRILNAAFKQEVWPDVWELETVLIIPKVTRPSCLGETRNISCTPIFAKTMEYFLLERLKTETKIKNNQFGRQAGSGTSHYLADALTGVMECLDQEGGTANLLSIDFAKAFNTMSHQACLAALHRKGTSGHVIRMTANFLKERQMQSRTGQSLLTKRSLRGRAPQGTLMGNFLIIIATDNLEDREDPCPPEREQSSKEDSGNKDEENCTYQEETPIREAGFQSLIDNLFFSTPTAQGQFAVFDPASPAP